MSVFSSNIPCSIQGPDGNTYVFLNYPTNGENVYFYESEDGSMGQLKFPLSYANSDKSIRYRALHYFIITPYGQKQVPRAVPYLYIPPETTDDIAPEATPLYESIGPYLSSRSGQGPSFAFWSNLSGDISSLPMDSLGNYLYDPDQILRFDSDALDDVDTDLYSSRILCEAKVEFDYLYAIGDSYDSTSPVCIPYIYEIRVLTASADGIILDFGAGGGGGGMRRHNHADNDNGGYAYSIFAPGTSLQPINWK